MKKAKVMLSAIAAVALVSAAFAFKANRASNPLFTGTASQQCVQVLATTTDDTSQPFVFTGDNNTDCTIQAYTIPSE